MKAKTAKRLARMFARYYVDRLNKTDNAWTLTYTHYVMIEHVKMLQALPIPDMVDYYHKQVNKILLGSGGVQ